MGGGEGARPGGGWGRAAAGAAALGGGAAAMAALYLAATRAAFWDKAVGSGPEDGEQDRAERERLQRAYTAMAESFRREGLDPAAVVANRKYFGGLSGAAGEWRTAWPREYADLTPPLPFPSVRLVVLPLSTCPRLRNLATAAAAAMSRELPAGCISHLQPPNSLHVSVFFVSHPSDVRPDAIRGGEEGSSFADIAPSAEAVVLEQEAVRSAVQSVVRRPRLVVEGVVFSRSGTLLLLFVEEGGGVVRRLRSDLRDVFKGAPAKQPNILHASLLRLLSPETLPAECLKDINRVCEEWTVKLRGQIFEPEHLWFVHEREFATVSGEKTRYCLP